MNKEFWFGAKTILAFLIILSLLDYFFPLLYPLDAAIIEFGTPFVFYTANLGPLPQCVEGNSLMHCGGVATQTFDTIAFIGDIAFAYFLGVFATFVRKKFEEGSSPIFKWTLRVAIFLACAAFIIRLFVRSF